jgi:hypothetical protein
MMNDQQAEKQQITNIVKEYSPIAAGRIIARALGISGTKEITLIVYALEAAETKGAQKAIADMQETLAAWSKQ